MKMRTLICLVTVIGTGCATTLPEDTVMPRILGKNLTIADEELTDICDVVECYNVDLAGDRSVFNSSNWKVVDQAPVEGTQIDESSVVCFGIIKNDEDDSDISYTMPDSCPKSALTEAKELDEAWIPIGFEEFTDSRKAGFAFDTQFGGLIECTRDGSTGRCYTGRLASKEFCNNGVALVVQWLNSLNEVVELSVFTTTGTVPPGGVVEFSAFLADRTWDFPVSPRLYQASC